MDQWLVGSGIPRRTSCVARSVDGHFLASIRQWLNDFLHDKALRYNQPASERRRTP